MCKLGKTQNRYKSAIPIPDKMFPKGLAHKSPERCRRRLASVFELNGMPKGIGCDAKDIPRAGIDNTAPAHFAHFGNGGLRRHHWAQYIDTKTRFPLPAYCRQKVTRTHQRPDIINRYVVAPELLLQAVPINEILSDPCPRFPCIRPYRQPL